jgi:hypothetical protein
VQRAAGRRGVVERWASIPGEIRRALAGLAARDLSLRGGSEGWSIRESVHHLVEANLVASNIVLAALGSPGCSYDWSWVNPGARWMRRLGYDRAPVEPALAFLEALCAHVARVVRTAPGALRRHVRLLDAPGARLRRRTVAQVLDDEWEHARHHLGDVAEARKARRRSGGAAGKTAAGSAGRGARRRAAR